MKKLFILFSILLLVGLGFSANTDRYNLGTVYNLNTTTLPSTTTAPNLCGYFETATSVTYVFRTTLATDSTDQRHSKPFFIADCNDADAYVQGITSAASDINVIYHFSYDDRNTWTIVTPATLDALSSTAVGDTVGLEAGTNDMVGFHTGIWLVVEFDSGSSATNLGEVVTWVATFTKDAYFSNQSFQWLPVARIANSSVTNP